MLTPSSRENNDNGGILRSGVPCLGQLPGLLVIHHSGETTNYAKIPSIWTSGY